MWARCPHEVVLGWSPGLRVKGWEGLAIMKSATRAHVVTVTFAAWIALGGGCGGEISAPATGGPEPSLAGRWSPFDPGGGGGVTDVVVHPSNPDIVWAVCDLSGIFKSVNGGVTFAHKGSAINLSASTLNGSNNQRHTLAIDPSNPNNVYYGYQPMGRYPIETLQKGGLWKSTDGGETWAQLTSAGAKALHRASLIVDRAGVIYGFETNSTTVRVSTDRGANFTSKAAPFALPASAQDGNVNILGAGGSSIVVAASPTNRVFVADFDSKTKGTWYSDNQGSHWTRITTLNGQRVSDLAFKPGTSDIALALTFNATTRKMLIWVSSDGGSSFEREGLELSAPFVTGGKSKGGIDMNASGLAIAWGAAGTGGPRARARSTLNGARGTWSHYTPVFRNGNYEWRAQSHGAANRLRAFPGASPKWFTSNLASALHSEDGGLTFTAGVDGIGIVTPTFLVVDSTNHQHVQIAVRDVGHARTVNSGATWTDVSATNRFDDAYGLAQDPASPGVWWRIARNGSEDRVDVSKSINGGSDWTKISSPDAFQVGSTGGPRMSIVPIGNTLYVGFRKSGQGIEGLYRSDNDGVTFARLSVHDSGFTSLVLRGMKLYGFTASDFGSDGSLMTFDIGNSTWQTLRSAADGGVTGFSIHPATDQTIFACEGTNRFLVAPGTPARGKLIKSTSGGSSWVEIKDGSGVSFNCRKLYIDPANPNIMLMSTHHSIAGSQQGVMRSRNGGATWSTFHGSLGIGDIVQFVYGGVPGRVFAVTQTMGSWRSDSLHQ